MNELPSMDAEIDKVLSSRQVPKEDRHGARQLYKSHTERRHKGQTQPVTLIPCTHTMRAISLAAALCSLLVASASALPVSAASAFVRMRHTN